VVILFPDPKKARRRKYLAATTVWPLEGNTNLAVEAAERNANRNFGKATECCGGELPNGHWRIEMEHQNERAR
jgi:hypothetical protein